jgi:hypothetical protein
VNFHQHTVPEAGRSGSISHSILRVFWPGLLFFAMLVPIVGTFLTPPLRPATLWFPSIHGTSRGQSGPVAELRLLPLDRHVVADANRILDELFLGPVNARHESLTMPGSYIDRLFLRRNTLYVDLQGDVFFGPASSQGVAAASYFNPAQIISIVRQTMAWNFPGKRIVLTIDGFEAEW